MYILNYSDICTQKYQLFIWKQCSSLSFSFLFHHSNQTSVLWAHLVLLSFCLMTYFSQHFSCEWQCGIQDLAARASRNAPLLGKQTAACLGMAFPGAAADPFADPWQQKWCPRGLSSTAHASREGWFPLGCRGDCVVSESLRSSSRLHPDWSLLGRDEPVPIVSSVWLLPQKSFLDF